MPFCVRCFFVLISGFLLEYNYSCPWQDASLRMRQAFPQMKQECNLPAEDFYSKDEARSTSRGSKWAFLARVFQISGGAIMLVVLPFWLTPIDFGIITIFTSIIALITIMQQAGLTEATIQAKENEREVRDAAFWLSGIIGIGLYLIVYILAPFLGTFFQNEQLILPLQIGGIQVILMGFTNIALAWLLREFKFRSYAWVQFVSSFVMVVIALMMAIFGYGYWAYIGGITGGAIARLIVTVRYMDWIPSKNLRISWWGVILKYGGFVLMEMLLGWFLVWFDNVAVARNQGSHAAGIYSLAFNFATMAISLPTSAVTGISLSVFSRLQDDLVKLQKMFLDYTEIIAAYALPACVGVCLIGPDLVNLVYPGRWNELGAVLRILALYAGIGHLWILNTDAFKAIGKPEIMVKIYIPVVIIMIPVYWWMSKIGLMQFTVARSLIVILGAFPHTYFAIRYIGLNRNYLFSATRAPIIASIIMAITIGIGMHLFDSIECRALNLIFLILLVLVGMIVYGFAMKFFAPEFTRKIISLLASSIYVKSRDY